MYVLLSTGVKRGKFALAVVAVLDVIGRQHAKYASTTATTTITTNTTTAVATTASYSKITLKFQHRFLT